MIEVSPVDLVLSPGHQPWAMIHCPIGANKHSIDAPKRPSEICYSPAADPVPNDTTVKFCDRKAAVALNSP